MIGGCEQREGAEHGARNVKYTPDGLETDLEAAYGPEAGIRTLHRSLALASDGLRLADEGTLRDARDVTWVFLLRRKPVWKDGAVRAGNLVIRCPEGLSFEAEEKPVTDPRMARNWPGSLWRVKLRSAAADRFRTTFIFSSAKGEM